MTSMLSLLPFRAQLFDLAVSFLPGLNAQEIGVLFGALKPALKVGSSCGFASALLAARCRKFIN